MIRLTESIVEEAALTWLENVVVALMSLSLEDRGYKTYAIDFLSGETAG